MSGECLISADNRYLSDAIDLATPVNSSDMQHLAISTFENASKSGGLAAFFVPAG
jgi:hypothetical protein